MNMASVGNSIREFLGLKWFIRYKGVQNIDDKKTIHKWKMGPFRIK